MEGAVVELERSGQATGPLRRVLSLQLPELGDRVFALEAHQPGQHRLTLNELAPRIAPVEQHVGQHQTPRVVLG